jgi:hypothetical protein
MRSEGAAGTRAPDHVRALRGEAAVAGGSGNRPGPGSLRTAQARAAGTLHAALRSASMKTSAKLDRNAHADLKQRLLALWQRLKTRFAPLADDDVKRAEQRHRGRNEPGEKR